jgi:hypothetical protein
MFPMESAEDFEATIDLIWTRAAMGRCPICLEALRPKIHQLELELSHQTISTTIILQHCTRCHAPANGLLADLEQILNTHDHGGQASHSELFEIVAFSVDDQWLAVEVHDETDQGVLSWAEYAQRLEERIELAETETVRRRFTPDHPDGPPTPDEPKGLFNHVHKKG